MYKLLLLALLICGCTHRSLTVQTQYFSAENLASYVVDTPDPLLNTPPIGQRLIISWDLKEWDWYEKFHLKLTVRYANREEITQDVALYKKSGYYLFEVMNSDYCETGGIQTYKVELIGDDTVLNEWRHQLWRDLIIIQPAE